MDVDDVTIHGFGSLSDGLTNRNEYLSANTTATREQSSLAIAIGAHPIEALNVFGQIRAQGSGSNLSTNLDWAFAEWGFSEALKLRAGRCKLPLGFYSEIRDVGTVRPFLFIPQGVYGLLEMSAEAYNGAGLTGSFQGERGWGLDYDVFAGNMSASLARTRDFARQGGPPPTGPEATSGVSATTLTLMAKLAGLRLSLSTPAEGLRLFVAGYYADQNQTTTQLTVAGAGVEYLRDGLSARLESFVVNTTSDAFSTGNYLELAYFVLPKWQIALRGELSRVTLSGDVADTSLLRHTEGAAGLNYWFSPQLVLKASLHLMDGNLFAQPTDLATAIANDTLEPRTLAFNVGAQFSF